MTSSTVIKAMRLSEQPTILVSFLCGLLDVGASRQFGTTHYLPVGLALALISIGTFVLNEFSDKATDALRPDRQSSGISGGATFFTVTCLAISGLTLGIYGGAPLCVSGACILGLLYSLPGFYLKRLVSLDLLSLGFCFVVFPYLAPREIHAGRLSLQVPPVALLNLAFLIFFFAACNLIGT